MVPPSQFFYRDTEAIRNSNDRVAATHYISGRKRTSSNTDYWDDKFISALNASTRSQSVYICDITRVGVQGHSNPVQGLSVTNHMEAPTRSFLLRDIFKPLRECIMRTDWNV